MGSLGSGSPKPERPANRMVGRLKGEVINELADRHSRRDRYDLRDLSGRVFHFAALGKAPPVGLSALLLEAANREHACDRQHDHEQEGQQ